MSTARGRTIEVIEFERQKLQLQADKYEAMNRKQPMEMLSAKLREIQKKLEELDLMWQSAMQNKNLNSSTAYDLRATNMACACNGYDAQCCVIRFKVAVLAETFNGGDQ